MACPSTNDPNDRAISFSAQYVLNGEYTASALFADCDCSDYVECGDICTPIRMKLDSDMSYNCCDDGESTDLSQEIIDCFEEDPYWINGLVRSYARNEKDCTTSLSISSYFQYLNSKAINTQNFYGASLSDVFNVIFSYYSGTPSSLYCLNSYDDIKIKGPVEGNSLISELRALATAGGANLFVQIGGCLTIEKWKDHNSPVELVIPPELTISANQAGYSRVNTSVLRVRGASISGFDCGTKSLTNNENGPGAKKKCVIVGIPSPCATMTFNNLNGTKEDILSSFIDSPTVKQLNQKKNIKDGTFSTEIEKKDGTNFGPTVTVVDTLITSQKYADRNEFYWQNWSGPAGGYGYGGNKSFFDNLAGWLQGAFPVPYSSFGMGAFGSKHFIGGFGSNSENKENFSDQPSKNQVETIVSKDNLYELCGIVTEDITNKYVPCKEILFRIGVRRYQEISLSENTWNVEVPYIPCLKLNQVVKFTVCETEECPKREITGVIGGINLENSPQENGGICTTMKLAISDLSCLGQTEYTSGNLVNNPCAGADSGGLNPWQTSALGIDSGSQVLGYSLNIYTYNIGSSALAYYDQAEMTVGDTYNFSFDYVRLQGNSSVFFSAPGAFSLNLFGNSGTVTGSFVATSPVDTFYWAMLGVTGGTYTQINNFSITKTIIA